MPHNWKLQPDSWFLLDLEQGADHWLQVRYRVGSERHSLVSVAVTAEWRCPEHPGHPSGQPAICYKDSTAMARSIRTILDQDSLNWKSLTTVYFETNCVEPQTASVDTDTKSPHLLLYLNAHEESSACSQSDAMFAIVDICCQQTQCPVHRR